MEVARLKLTVLFQEPFWIGLCERESGGHYEVCKVIFGAEPKDVEVYDLILKHWNDLSFSPALRAEEGVERHVNPKRMQRLIHTQTQPAGIGTKAQRALQLQREQGKIERKTSSRQQREEEQERQFTLRQEKRKEKHKGH